VEEEEKRVKVIDRRHFTSEGERRDLGEDEMPARGEADPGPARPPEPEEATPAEDPAFKELVMFLVQNALAALGQLPGPRGKKAEINADAAAAMIEWLDALERKTRNSLAPEEKQLFGEYLYQLKMLYVKAKQGGRP
jgi:hypothetical protein